MSNADAKPARPAPARSNTITEAAPQPPSRTPSRRWAAALVLLTAVVVLSAGIRLLTGKRVILASRAE